MTAPATTARVGLGDNGTAPGRWVRFFCPGCNHVHGVTVDSPDGWGWNGDQARPTITPSILVHSHKTLDENERAVDTPQCHSFVREGRIEFLGDCTHALAGQTVELQPWNDGMNQ